MTKRTIATISTALCIAALAATPAANAAEETQTHLFDATLTLTGDCSTNLSDPVPDPGLCPMPPGVKGVDHPNEPFRVPAAIAVDAYGNRYVGSRGSNFEGRVDVFAPSGEFITEIAVPRLQHIAVDSSGNLYASSSTNPYQVRYYTPITYDPQAGNILYKEDPVVLQEIGEGDGGGSPTINPLNDHLFIGGGGIPDGYIQEYSSAAEGNKPLDKFGVGDLIAPRGFAIDAAAGRIYATTYIDTGGPVQYKPVVRVFELSAPHALLGTIDGSETPPGKFTSLSTDGLGLAVEEATGDLFVADLGVATPRVFEFDGGGSYVGQVKGTFKAIASAEIEVDNGANSPTKGYLFVPSNENPPARSLAFEPIPIPTPPEVESLSVTGIAEEEAVLHAKVNPSGEASSYRFELITQQAFDEEGGFAGAAIVKEGTLGASSETQPVSAAASSLEPGTAYRFRVVAENESGEDEAESSFSTFGSGDGSTECANEALRTGASAALPDCRAYELVTPADTNAHPPRGSGFHPGLFFPAFQASPQGDKVSFVIEGGIIPDLGGTGGLFGTPYLATRSPAGWDSASAGPDGVESPWPILSSFSLDQGYTFWGTNGGLGTAAIDHNITFYVRYPDGHSELIGRGSLGTDPGAEGRQITEDGAHIVFDTEDFYRESISRQLEPNAPPEGTSAVYDRTADEVTHVVSLLPGEVTPGAGQDAKYVGASADGEGIAFTIGGKLYLRKDNQASYAVAPQEALSGHRVSCDPESSQLAGATPTYEWLLDGSPIPGATSSIYTPQASQAGSLLQCRVRAANTEGGAIAIGQALLIDHAHEGGQVPRPQGAGVPALPASPSVGDTLQCETGTWSAEPSFAFQWYRDGDPIAGATSASYQVQAADAQTQLQCAITATASGTSVLAVAGSREVEPPAPPAGVSPSISNVSNPGKAPVVGNQLSCDKGSWQNAPILAVQWLANGAAIAAATADTYTLTAAEEGKAVQCELSATNADGITKAVSNAVAVEPTLGTELPSGSISVTGIKAVGQTLECDKGSWGGSPTFTHQWLSDGAPIASATSSTYTLTAAERETVVQCVVTATNAKGTVVAIAGGFVNQKPSPLASTPALEVTFAGISEEGERLFYAQGGELFAYDTESEASIPFSESAHVNGTGKGDVTVVNVSTEGKVAYFVSPTVLTGGPNPNGDVAEEGEQNLYRSAEGTIDFVGTVTTGDVGGGLGFWTQALASGHYASDPSRSTPDGEALLFESSASLTGESSGGHRQVYRYDASGELACLSCSPTGIAPTADAAVQPFASSPIEEPPLTRSGLVPTLRADGRRAFFQSPEPLVLADTDGLLDVYEWEEDGVGSCHTVGGCVYLISSPNSARNEYLYAVSRGGDDVFFSSSDLLTPAFDPDETPSIYDARVGGGFAPPGGNAGECLGEACQPVAVAPNDPTPASSSFQGAGNVTPEGKAKQRCAKGKKAVRTRGKVRCVPKKHKKNHKKRANANGRAGR